MTEKIKSMMTRIFSTKTKNSHTEDNTCIIREFSLCNENIILVIDYYCSSKYRVMYITDHSTILIFTKNSVNEIHSEIKRLNTLLPVDYIRILQHFTMDNKPDFIEKILKSMISSIEDAKKQQLDTYEPGS